MFVDARKPLKELIEEEGLKSGDEICFVYQGKILKRRVEIKGERILFFPIKEEKKIMNHHGNYFDLNLLKN